MQNYNQEKDKGSKRQCLQLEQILPALIKRQFGLLLERGGTVVLVATHTKRQTPGGAVQGF